MKTNLDSKFKTDPVLEKEGIWVRFSSEVSFLVRRMGGANTSKLKASYAKFCKPYAYQIQTDSLDEAKDRELQIKVFVDACLINWEGIIIDGEEVPFSFEKAVDLFEALPEVFDFVRKAASDFNGYREDLGNS